MYHSLGIEKWMDGVDVGGCSSFLCPDYTRASAKSLSLLEMMSQPKRDGEVHKLDKNMCSTLYFQRIWPSPRRIRPFSRENYVRKSGIAQARGCFGAGACILGQIDGNCSKMDFLGCRNVVGYKTTVLFSIPGEVVVI